MKVLLISKYAATPETENPSRQYFFAKELAELGHEVLLVNSVSNGVNRVPNTKYREPVANNTDNLQILTMPGPIIKLGMNLKRMWTWLLFEMQLLFATKRFREFSPDVVLVSSLSFFSFLNGIRLKRKFGVSLAIEVRDLYPMTLIEVGGMSQWNPIVLFMGWIEKRAYRWADLIISSLERAHVHVQVVIGVKDKGFFWLPMGMAEGLYEDSFNDEIVLLPSDPSVRWDDRVGLAIEAVREIAAAGNFVVGYAGTFGAANALGEIMELTRDAEILAKGVHFVFIGGGPLRVQFEREYGSENVHFFDAVPKKFLPLVLAQCDVLFNAWLKRGIYDFGVSPNKWIDYMYSARPILLALQSDSTIFRESDSGWQIAAEDKNELKNSLLDICGLAKEVLDKKGQNGREYLEKHLSYKELGQKLEKELISIVNKG